MELIIARSVAHLKRSICYIFSAEFSKKYFDVLSKKELKYRVSYVLLGPYFPIALLLWTSFAFLCDLVSAIFFSNDFSPCSENTLETKKFENRDSCFPPKK